MIRVINVSCLSLCLLVIAITPIASQRWGWMSQKIVRLRHDSIRISVGLVWVIIFQNAIRGAVLFGVMDNLGLGHYWKLLLHFLLASFHFFDVYKLRLFEIFILSNTLLFLSSLKSVGRFFKPSVDIISWVSDSFRWIDDLVGRIRIGTNDGLLIINISFVLLSLKPELTVVVIFLSSLKY